MKYEGYDVIPYVRISQNDPTLIKRVLETGCYGIIVPMVNSSDDVGTAVNALYYQPVGSRGVGLSRAQGYGIDFQRYKNWYENNISLIVQIEDVKAIQNLNTFISNDKIDCALIGPYDLSASVGKPGNFSDPEVNEKLQLFENTMKTNQKCMGYHIVHPTLQEIGLRVQNGYRCIILGIDEIYLAKKSMECLTEAKNIAVE